MSRNHAASSSQPNPINVMKQWAAHCEKEMVMTDKWYENWSDVYFPGQKVGKMEDRIDELSKRVAELDNKIDQVKEARSKIALETFESPFKVKRSTVLKPSYPFNG